MFTMRASLVYLVTDASWTESDEGEYANLVPLDSKIRLRLQTSGLNVSLTILSLMSSKG